MYKIIINIDVLRTIISNIFFFFQTKLLELILLTLVLVFTIFMYIRENGNLPLYLYMDFFMKNIM